MEYKIIKLNEDTWSLEEDGVRCFLLAGEKEALLIDCGMWLRNIREICAKLTPLPVRLLLTHADGDHTGCADEFETAYMHLAECSNFYNGYEKRSCLPDPLWDGQILDLGGRELEIVSLPGHTPGSVAIIDRKYRVMFSGDTVQQGGIFMFGVQREIHAYLHSLKRALAISDRYDKIYPSHGPCPIYFDTIEKLISGTEKIIAGELPFEITSIFGHSVKQYSLGCAAMLCDLEK